MDLNEYVNKYLNEVKMIAEVVDKNSIASLTESVFRLKGRLFVLGVGGSAANASHAVNDFRKILGIETYAINDNVAELTARINDDGWETCYSNWLKVSKLNKDDAILVFSVGGGSNTTSLNLVTSMEYAKIVGATILSVVSRDGGKAKELSNCCVLIPKITESRITPHAEEWQGIILHLIVNAICEMRK